MGGVTVLRSDQLSYGAISICYEPNLEQLVIKGRMGRVPVLFACETMS